MLKVENLVPPSPEQFEVVLKGMRLPFKSGDKSDSEICKGEFHFNFDKSNYPQFCCTEKCEQPSECFFLGENDEKLLLNLCKAGDPSHRKVLRQLPVKAFITAPLYWWKQMDQYKVGTVTNSESTMHTMTKYPFKVEDFSVENFLEIDGEETNWLECREYEDSDLWFDGIENDGYCFTTEEYFQENFVNLLNSLRIFYLKTDDKKYWHALNELLPQSYNQTRCWSGNYENLVTIINQRSGHKLGEWKTFIDYMLENVPYLKEIVEAVNG